MLKKAFLLLIILLALPSLWAQNIPVGLEYEIVGGRSVTITRYTGDATILSIPAQIQGLPVTAIGDRAFYNCISLTSITIPSSIISIGDYAFSECSGLTSIAIPSSVTYISDRAFWACYYLTSITVDDRNSAYASIDGVLFDKNIRTIIKFPAGKIAGNYSIPSSVTSITGDDVFSITWGVDGLTSITIPSSVTFINNYAFSSCSGLVSINVDRYNPVYASIDGVLFDKNIRTLIRYPRGKTEVYYSIPSSVTTIGHEAFDSCRNLTSITIPSSATLIGYGAFSYCSNLASITIPSSVISIGDFAFYESGLTSVTIPSSVTDIGAAAFFNWVLLSATISRRTSVGQDAFPETARIIYSD